MHLWAKGNQGVASVLGRQVREDVVGALRARGAGESRQERGQRGQSKPMEQRFHAFGFNASGSVGDVAVKYSAAVGADIYAAVNARVARDAFKSVAPLMLVIVDPHPA